MSTAKAKPKSRNEKRIEALEKRLDTVEKQLTRLADQNVERATTLEQHRAELDIQKRSLIGIDDFAHSISSLVDAHANLIAGSLRWTWRARYRRWQIHRRAARGIGA